MAASIRFGNVAFNHEVGELIRTDSNGQESVVRLQPQPSRLLKLLIDGYPNAVTREQIQAAIWPDVQVDFDGSMHFCIRQIRAALNDSANEPSYIETIPRRGYRWLVAVESKPEEATDATASATLAPVSNPKPAWKRYWPLIGLGCVLPLILLVALRQQPAPEPAKTRTTSTTVEKTRIAIMPFSPADTSSGFYGNNIAFQLVEELTNDYFEQVEIIGPTTTNGTTMTTLVLNLEVDLVVGAKFITRENEPRMLVEVIRSSDRAHLWVRSYAASVPMDSIAQRVKRGVAGQFMP